MRNNGLVDDSLAYIREWRRRLLQSGWWHSFELPDGTRIEGVSDLEAQKMRIGQFPIAQDLSGKRVLDIGTWDGWFAFEMERRGAEVVAIDRWDNPRFHEMRSRLGSRVEYRQVDVHELSPGTVGYFDIVLFMGVLYHVKHPLLALERVCSVTREMAAVESFVLPGSGNHLQFYEDDDFGGQVDNWFAPTADCLQALCRTGGFARAELVNRHEYGAAVACHRDWGDLPGNPAAPGVELLGAVNPDNYGINFRSAKDEYVTCRISAPPGMPVSRDTIFPEVGPYGVRAIFAGRERDAGTLVQFKLPPGLSAGWHEVRLLASGRHASNAVRIAVDMECMVTRLSIGGVCDGVTWEPRLSSEFLSLWVEGLPENADIANVTVALDGRRQLVEFAGTLGEKGVRQVNVRVDGCAAGRRELVVSCGGVQSPGVQVEVVQSLD